MEIVYHSKALEDVKYWRKSGQKQIQQRIAALLLSIQETPFEGIGKPEQLKHDWTGTWSRRINHEHRMVYGITNDELHIYSLKDHY